MSTSTQRRPLDGITILDLTVMTAGPVGTMLLGDLGADVIKVEEPAQGDLARGLGTQFVEGESVQFLSQNRNKRSVRLDLKTPAGREVFLRLARAADVVVENFRPGTVDRLGIGYDAVKALNPRVIYASVSGFGQSGPYAGWPANDPIVQAVSGVMDMTGEADGRPGRVGAPLPDFGAAKGREPQRATGDPTTRTDVAAAPLTGENETLAIEHHLVAAGLPLHLLGPVHQAVALVGRLEFHLAGGRELEALLGAALGLHLGHFLCPSIG